MDQQIPSTETLKAGSIKKQDGKEFIYAYSAAGVTAKTMVKLSYSSSLNPRVAAQSDSATQARWVIPNETVAATSWGWFHTRGLVEDAVAGSTITVTAGHALKHHNRIITSMTAAFAGNNYEFGVCPTGAAGKTTLDIYLYGRESLGTT